MKKWIALFLVCILALGCLGAASAETKEPVKIVYAFSGNGMQNDTLLVEEAMNEWLKAQPEYAHITIELLPCGGASQDLKTTIALAQASGEQIDIANTWGITIGDYVKDGYAIPIDALLADTEIANELPAWLLETGKVGQETYFVPNYQLPATNRYVAIPKEYLQYYAGGAEAVKEILLLPKEESYKQIEFYGDLVKAVREGTGKDTKWIFGTLYPIDFTRYDLWVINHSIFVEVGSNEVINVWAEDWWRLTLKALAQLYTDGYVHPDTATIDTAPFTNANLLNDESGVRSISQGLYVAPENVGDILELQVSGIDCVLIPEFDRYYMAGSWAAGGNWITSTCRHPEEAMDIIELLNTKKGTEFYNLLVYGIEGRQYTRNEDGSIHTLEYDASQAGSSVSYMTPGWMVGNTINQYENQSYVAGQKELIEAVGTSSLNVTSELSGLVLDTTAVTDQIAQTNAAINEYWTLLTSGAIGAEKFDAYYDELLAKMEAAGVQTILTEVQGQIDAFLAAK